MIVVLALPAAAAAGDLRPVSAGHWYKCNTHTHTSARPQSDANGTPEHVARWYKDHGYQCLVITDHEYLTDVDALNAGLGHPSAANPGRESGTDNGQASGHGPDFLVIKGQEITQAALDPSVPGGVRHAHVNAINLHAEQPILPIGYPNKPQGMPLAQIYERNIAAVYAAGGIPQVNHPNLLWSVRVGDLLPVTQPFLLEIWNAYPTSNNLGGTDDAGHVSPSTEQLWDDLLSHGKIVWGVGSDDAHEYQSDDREAPTPGKAWVVVRAEALTIDAITAALRTGQFYASTGISLESYSANHSEIAMRIAATREWSPMLKPSSRYTTRFIGANGKVLSQVTGSSPRYRMRGGEHYVRASIVDSDGRRAWTQPVFLDGRAASSATYP